MTTPSSPEPSAWWPTTWGALLAGDDVQAPDGSTWMVAGSLVSDGAGEWAILSEGGCRVWTPHRVDEPVTARRYPFSGSAQIEGMLRPLFPDLKEVDPATASRRPGAGRWLLCGREVCTCRW